MKFVAPIYILLIAIYNLWGNNDNVYWVIYYYVVIHSVMAALFFKLAHDSVIKNVSNVYRIGGIFSCFYVVFHIVVLLGFADEFTSLVDSVLWSVICFVGALLTLITFWYDKKNGNSID